MRSYRTYLKAAGIKSIAGLKLRTEKRPGDVEIIHVGKGEYRKHVYGRPSATCSRPSDQARKSGLAAPRVDQAQGEAA